MLLEETGQGSKLLCLCFFSVQLCCFDSPLTPVIKEKIAPGRGRRCVDIPVGARTQGLSLSAALRQFFFLLDDKLSNSVGRAGRAVDLLVTLISRLMLTGDAGALAHTAWADH